MIDYERVIKIVLFEFPKWMLAIQDDQIDKPVAEKSYLFHCI